MFTRIKFAISVLLGIETSTQPKLSVDHPHYDIGWSDGYSACQINEYANHDASHVDYPTRQEVFSLCLKYRKEKERKSRESTSKVQDQ